MSDFTGSTTNPAYRDRTMTPRWLFDALDLEFNFALDAAALPETALCRNYLTPEIDALKADWADYLPAGRLAPWCWLNPPYSDPGPWVLKAMAEQERGIGTVMLVPADQTAEWYPGDMASEIRLITGYYDEAGKWKSGRINFINAETGQEMKGNPKGSMLLIFAPGYKAQCRITNISKGELMLLGQKVPRLKSIHLEPTTPSTETVDNSEAAA